MNDLHRQEGSKRGVTVATRTLELPVAFPDRLASLRKQRGLTQQALADQVGLHVIQVRRYERGSSQPTLDVIRRLAVALRVSADALVFESDERGPDEDLRLKFEAVRAMADDDKHVIASLLDAYIKKHQIESVLAR
jgi:transcriptional regulator with XRE-family HTH domain